MLYNYAVPKVLKQYKGKKTDGKVVYNDREVVIPATVVNEVFVNNVASLIKRLASSEAPAKIANNVECGFCDIAKADCPERAADTVTQEVATGDF
jgi:hypothetical protein